MTSLAHRLAVTPPPLGLLVLLDVSSCKHAVATTPVGSQTPVAPYRAATSRRTKTHKGDITDCPLSTLPISVMSPFSYPPPTVGSINGWPPSAECIVIPQIRVGLTIFLKILIAVLVKIR